MSLHISHVTLHPERYPSLQHYPFSLPIFQHAQTIPFDSPITFFVGENGSGKSTLLDAIARACNVHIWNRDDGVRCKGNPYEKLLYRYLSVNFTNGIVPGSYFGSEKFSDFRKTVEGWAASDPDQLEYLGGKSLVTQSHGQSMMSFFASRYKIEGLYFLDEPETALSPKSLMTLIEIIQQNAEAGHAQFIIATHSPLLLSCTRAKIYNFDDAAEIGPIHYKDTEHYKIYKQFFEDTQ